MRFGSVQAMAFATLCSAWQLGCEDPELSWIVSREGEVQVIRASRSLPPARDMSGGVEMEEARACESLVVGPKFEEVVDAEYVASGIAVLDGSGRVFLIDREQGTTRQFPAQGDALAGLKEPISLVSTATTVGVWDAEEGVLVRFSLAGEVLGLDTLSIDAGDLFPGYLEPKAPPRMHGRLVQHRGRYFTETRPREQQKTGSETDGFIVSASGNGVDTLHSFRVDSYGFQYGDHWVCCLRTRIFSPQPGWGFLSDGTLVFSSGRSGALEFFLSGSPVKVVKWKVGNLDLSDDVFIWYWEAEAKRALGGESEERLRQKKALFLQNLPRKRRFFSRRGPAVTRLLVDDADRVWLRRFDRGAWPDGLGSTWDRFSREGSYLGAIQLPCADYVLRVKGDEILASYLDEEFSERLIILKSPN